MYKTSQYWTKTHTHILHPNEIVGKGPPSVDYKESDKKDNQISISGHSYNLKVLRRGPFLHYKLMSLRRGPSFTLKIDG